MRLDSVLELKRRLVRRGRLTALADSVGDDVAESYWPNPSQVGVALGVSRTGGLDDYAMAIRVQRNTKAAAEFVEYAAGEARGEVDIQLVGSIRVPGPRASSGPFTKRQRPLRPGYSVAHGRVSAGTLGAFVVDAKDQVCILSNNHVLADTNAGKKGDRVYQPGPADVGGARPTRNHVGWLEDHVKLTQDSNLVDAATASIRDALDFDTIYDGRYLDGTRSDELDVDDEVWKLGRTTGMTEGMVSAVDLDDVSVDYDGENYVFDGQIEITGSDGLFSAGGDSGSLIIDADDQAAALLFAGSTKGLTYANPIQAVFDKLGLVLYE